MKTLKTQILICLLLILFGCNKQQALVQSSAFVNVERIVKTHNSNEHISIINPKKADKKISTNSLRHMDTLDVKLDTLTPPKTAKIDTTGPLKANIDSILVKKENPFIIQKADKTAKQSYNLGFISLVLSLVFWPLGLIAGIVAIALGKKAIKMGTKTPKRAKDGIIMGKLSILFFFISIIIAVLLLIWIINMISNVII